MRISNSNSLYALSLFLIALSCVLPFVEAIRNKHHIINKRDICGNNEQNPFQEQPEYLSWSAYATSFGSLTKGQVAWLYLIQTEDLTQLNTYVKTFAPFLIFVCFSGVSLILWIIYIACYRNPRYCFRKNLKQSYNENSWIFYILFLIVTGCSIVSGVFAFGFAVKFSDQIQRSTCSLVSTFNDIIMGQSRAANWTLYKNWLGLNTIDQVLEKSIQGINDIMSVSDTMFDLTGWMYNEPEIFRHNITSINVLYKTRTLPSANPQHNKFNQTFIPVYIAGIGDVFNHWTLFGAIYNEYLEKIYNPSLALISLRSNYFEIIKHPKNIADKLYEVRLLFRSIKYALDYMYNTFISDWIHYYTLARVSFNYLFISLFSINIILNLCTFIMILLIVNMKLPQKLKAIMKITITLSMHVISFFLIFSFWSGFGFIWTGYVSRDSVKVLNFIFGRENLLSDSPMIVRNRTISSYLNTCFNSDGDWYHDFNLTNSNLTWWNELYLASNILYKRSLQYRTEENKDNRDTEYLPRWFEDIDNYKDNNNYKVTTLEYGMNDISTIHKELTKYTSKGVHQSQSCFDLSTDDEFVSHESQCIRPYFKVTRVKDWNVNKGNPTCWIINEWTKEMLNKRYNRACNWKPASESGFEVKFNTVENATQYYYDYITYFQTENNKLINDIKDDWAALNSTFNKWSDQLYRDIALVAPLTNITYNIFFNSVRNGAGYDNNDIFSMFNCKYIQYYFGFMYNMWYVKVGKSSMAMGGWMWIHSWMIFCELFLFYIVKAIYLPWYNKKEINVIIKEEETKQLYMEEEERIQRQLEQDKKYKQEIQEEYYDNDYFNNNYNRRKKEERLSNKAVIPIIKEDDYKDCNTMSPERISVRRVLRSSVNSEMLHFADGSQGEIIKNYGAKKGNILGDKNADSQPISDSNTSRHGFGYVVRNSWSYKNEDDVWVPEQIIKMNHGGNIEISKGSNLEGFKGVPLAAFTAKLGYSVYMMN